MEYHGTAYGMMFVSYILVLIMSRFQAAVSFLASHLVRVEPTFTAETPTVIGGGYKVLIAE